MTTNTPKKYMDITIAPDGEVSMETHGTHGTECEEQINLVMATLGGGKITERKNKSEFYEDGGQPVFRMNRIRG